ncbi:MFS transporter [Marisediminicola sp. LYQ85]|uniref:MFS transporter n=1 Tax=Marisediminicola sp. LYQ85 TaxID=3391062 RepID=UPI00398392CB
MWLRRAFYYVQIAAIIAVPLWIVVARSIATEGVGAIGALVFVIWPTLAIAMVAVLFLTWGRKSVRSTRTLSWIDVGALSAWYLTAIGYGVAIAVADSLFAGLLAGVLFLVTVAVFWVAVWQLITAARKRVETVLASLDQTAVPAGEYQATRFARGDGDVIRIDPPSGSSSSRS